MNITSTKKIFLLLLTLLCAIAAGAGVLFGAFGSGNTYAEEESITSAIGAKEETDIDGYGAKEETTEDNAVNSSSAEIQYDYDDNAAWEIADLWGIELSTVRSYLSAHECDGWELLEQLKLEIEEGHDHEKHPLAADFLEYCEQLSDPDDGNRPSVYATYVGYTNKSHMSISGATSTTDWTTFNSGGANSTVRGSLGARCTASAPIGTLITLNISFHNTTYNFIEREDNEHWSINSRFYVGDHNSNGQSLANQFIIDGDAPTGTVFRVTKFFCNGCNCTGKNSYYSLVNGNSSNSNKYFTYEVTVRRTTNPQKPTIRNDGLGVISTTNTANDTLTKTYMGTPARIEFTPDRGVGLITWSEATGNVTIYSRSVHAETTSTLILECSTAGTYTIRLTSFSNTWSDGTTGALTFRFIVNSQTTTKPKIVREDGVAANGQSKYVNDTGGRQTISFFDCDQDYVTASSNGLYEQSWTTGNVLTLYQSVQGNYTVTLSLTNSNGCTWDDGSTDPVIFSFRIAEMLIERPEIVGAGGSNTITLEYNKNEQTITMSPVLEGQMMITASGLVPTYNAATRSVSFGVTNAGQYEIRMSPSIGYIWDDGSSNNISFFIVITPLKMSRPVLNEPTAVGIRKTVVFDTAPGAFSTLTIDNYDPEGLSFTSPMTQLSWTPDESGKGTGTLVLRAITAQVYSVIISCRPNYEWDSSVSTRTVTYVLEIQRAILGIPTIIRTTEGNLADADTIEGETKTIAYETVRDNASLGYMKIFVGGTNSSQVNVDITPTTNANNRLVQTWNAEEHSLTLTGTQADSYLLVLTPTENYQWAEGDKDLRNFKFVISPILRDSIGMEIFNPASNSWEQRPTLTGNLSYDGAAKLMRIGHATNDNIKYDPTAMNYVINAASTDRDRLQYLGTSYGGDTSNGFIYFSAVQAGTYSVTVKLRNTNYNWRAGAGADLDFTFIVDPQAIAAPSLQWGECGGYRLVVDGSDPNARYMYSVYDSTSATMVIGIDVVTELELEDIIDITFESSNGKEIRRNRWQNSTEQPSKVSVSATDAGYYTVTLTIKDPNYGWREDVPDYTFELTISPAPIEKVTFTYNGTSSTSGVNEVINPDGEIESFHIAEYAVGAAQRILVTRSFVEDVFDSNGNQINVTQKFDAINYENMFTYSIYNIETGESYDTGRFVDVSHILLQIAEAGTYLLSVAPNENYCWWADEGQYEYVCSFEVTPRAVPLPVLYVEDEGVDQVHYDDDTKNAVYNRRHQQLRVSLGDDYMAYEVDSVSYGMQEETTEQDNRWFVYYAVNRGRYDLVIKLRNTNFVWAEEPNYGDMQIFHLAIARAGVDIPTAWLVENEGFSDAETEGTQLLHQDTNIASVEYRNSPYFVYLFGDIVTSREVAITIDAATDNYNSENLLSQYVQGDGGTDAAYEIRMRTANIFYITVSFTTFTNAEGNEEYNYYWNHGSDEYDTTDKTFTLEIRKRVLAIPKIQGDESAVGEDNNFYKHYIFNYGHRDMTIVGYLPGFMSYEMDGSRLAVDTNNTDIDNSILTVTTDLGRGGPQYASVAEGYFLTMILDAANERWQPADDGTLDEDTANKVYWIVIDKIPISAPTVYKDVEGDDIFYDDVSKSVLYNGESWNNAFFINDIYDEYVAYTLASAVTMQGTYSTSVVVPGDSPDGEGNTIGSLIVSAASEAGSYNVLFSLKDPINMRWDITDVDSEDLTYSFIVRPVTFDKVLIRNEGETDAVYTDSDKTVTYNYNYQDFTIDNLIIDSNNRYMTVEVISGQFSTFQTNAIDDVYSSITYSARTAGTYTVRIRLSNNATWGDGEPRFLDLSFKIDKLQFTTPFIVDDEADAVVSGTTKTVSYELDSDFREVLKTIYIDEYNVDIMAFAGQAVTVNEGQSSIVDWDYDVLRGYYYLSAYKAGTYTLTFRILDFVNTRWEFADRETITFTFRIDKLALKTPTIDQTYLINGETVSGSAFTATYDGRQHVVMLNDVLVYANNAASGEYYMIYTSSSATDSQDRIAVQHYSDRSTADFTVGDIYGSDHDGQYIDSAIAPSDSIDKRNILLFEAGMPGTYTVTVSLVNTANMCFDTTSATSQTYTLRIGKYVHTAPRVRSGSSAQLQYNGSEQNFYITDAFNGNDARGFEYETLQIGNAVTTVQNAVWELVSWVNGTITLKAKEVGTYRLTVSIKDTNTTAWSNNTANSITFTFTITERNVGATISYSAPDDATLNASLGGGATSWAISSRVVATLYINDIVERLPEGVVDSTIILEVYTYYNSTPNNRLNQRVIGTNTWTIEPVGGAYRLAYDYELPYGDNVMRRGNYTILVNQSLATGNYRLSQQRFSFTIGADPAPFNTNMIVWQYTIGDDEDTRVTIPNWSTYNNAQNAYPLDYIEDGRDYNFNLYLNERGMNGFDNAGYTDLEAALISWEVRFSSYGGTRTAHYAGVYSVRATIVARDSAVYAFPTFTTTFYYRINQVLYDLSGLEWDYDESNPFTYDGTVKSVKLKGTLPTGLTVQSYLVSGYDLNTQTFAGNYNTSLVFVSSNRNYLVPNLNNPASYINDGSFVPNCRWQIRKAELPVEWMTVQDDTGDGSALVYVPILQTHAEKVNYVYEKWDGTNWNVVTNFAHEGAEQFRVTANLKASSVAQTSSAYNGELDYARNYELVFVMEPDPRNHSKEFILGGNSSTIGVYAVVGGTQLSTTAPYNVYAYNGSPYPAQLTVFYDPTGYITTNNISITYYSSVNYNKPLSGAPVDPGNYRIRLALRNVNSGDGTEYELGTKQFDFVIEKGTFRPEDIIWSYDHTDLTNTSSSAHWDVDQNKWIDDVSGEEVTFVYDGAAHIVTLKSRNPALSIAMKGYSQINAGSYTSNATYSYDATRWNAPTTVTSFDWTVEKAVIDISEVNWNYEDPFVYTLSGGVAKRYSVALSGVNALLSDYISYSTVNSVGDSVANSIGLAGTYVTTVTVADMPENSNYVAGEWPSTVSKSCTWVIEQRILSVPQSSNLWTVFDGAQHNLLTSVTLDTDWQEYYNLSIRYSDGTNTSAYNGTTDYGYIYTAYNAGSYIFTFALKPAINSNGINVLWDGGDENTTQNQEYTLDVRKAELTVTGWNTNDEMSTVILTCDDLPAGTLLEKFISYKFYLGIGTSGSEVSLDYVLNTETAEDFTIAPYVKPEYGTNITIVYASPDLEYYAYTSIDISGIPDEDRIQVNGKPEITAYILDGITYTFSPEMMNEEHVYVIYGGGPVTFVIDRWESYFVNYLDVWGGDSLTQEEAGIYTVTYVLKKSATNPLYWSKTGDDVNGYTYDRSSVTLTFEIRYLMLDVPSYEDNAKYSLDQVTYNGNDIDILSTSLTEEQMNELKDQYGDYVEISGNVGRNAGSYTMYLRIKDEYVNVVRWNNGTQFGQPGTFNVVWTIDPIYLVVPRLSSSLAVIYSGAEHSVFEALEGYSEDAMSQELNDLLRYAKLSSNGSRGINAGYYTAVFSLQDDNYAWKNSSGNVISDTTVTIENWRILPKTLDMSGVHWNYSEASPFVFGYENGVVTTHTIELLGIPEEIKDYIEYNTNGSRGNSASAVGTYNTNVRLFALNGADASNYTLVQMPQNFIDAYYSPDADVAINWRIVGKRLPVPTDQEKDFDNTVIDLLDLFGFEEGWENYLDVDVEFSADGVTFAPYDVENNEVVGYSIYNVFELGYYRLTLSIKDNLVDGRNSVVWAVGSAGTTNDQHVMLTYKQLEIVITGWTDEVEDSAVISTKLSELAGTDAMNMFEYIITDMDDGNVYTPEQVSTRGSGYTYYKLFRIKPENEYAISDGVKITFNDGVDNPYLFGNYNYGSQPETWLPIPEFELAEQDFTGGDVVFKIKNWETYAISDEFRTAFNNNTRYAAEGFHINDDVLSFIYAMDGSLDTSNGTVTVTKAGDYKMRVRFTSGIRLSWYDSSKYSVRNGLLVELETGTTLTQAQTDALVSRYSQTIEYKVNAAILELVDLRAFLENMPTITYDGTLKDVRSNFERFFRELEETYGSLISITGYSGTAVDTYTVHIALSDAESSAWNLNEYETLRVETEGYALDYYYADGRWSLMFVAVDENGDAILDENGDYILYNDGNYSTNAAYKYSYSITYVPIGEGENEAQLDENGVPVPKVIGTDSEGNDILAQYIVDEDGKAIRYASRNGIEAPEGNYVAMYVLDEDGNRVLNALPDMVDGHPVLDKENSYVTVRQLKTSVEDLTFDWRIIPQGLVAPYVQTSDLLVYTSQEINVEDYGSAIIGYRPEIMRIEDGTAVNAGEHTAKVYLTDANYNWYSEDGTPIEYVTFTWSIAKATVDLQGLKWSYDETTEFTYTLKNGKAKAYKVELVFPDEIKAYSGLVEYTTNGTVGAHAGRNAGKYETSFTFNFDMNNFENIIYPEGLEESIVWYINKRVLIIPELKDAHLAFTDEIYDALQLLSLPDDWNNYYNLEINYIRNNILPEAYFGYDADENGVITDAERYLLHGVGTYRFTLSIKPELNTDSQHPNVVWYTGTTEPDTEGSGDGELIAPTAVRNYTFMILPRAVQNVEQSNSVTVTDKSPIRAEKPAVAKKSYSDAALSNAVKTAETQAVEASEPVPSPINVTVANNTLKRVYANGDVKAWTEISDLSECAQTLEVVPFRKYYSEFALPAITYTRKRNFYPLFAYIN